jgi:hypothetical protein
MAYYDSTNDYESIREYILKGRSKIDRKVANNTIARIEEDKIIIKYHSSDIAELTQFTRKLFSGGYKTYTTKERLNWYIPSPYSLYQSKGVWYIWNYQDKSEHVFAEGLEFYMPYGVDPWEINQNTCADKSAADKIKSLRKKINAYTNQYVKLLISDKLDTPGGGDCWYCHFQTQNDESLGESSKDTDHLESHFDEKYYVPSMLMNSIRFYSMSPLANGTLHELWFNSNPSDKDISWGLDILERQAKSSLRKFLLRQFNIG